MNPLHDLRDLGAPAWYLSYLYNEVPTYTLGVAVRAAAPLVLALGHAQAVNKRLANQCLQLNRELESRNKSLANARKEKREQEASNSSRNRYIAQLQQTIKTLQADNRKLQEAYNQRKVMDFGLVYGVGGNVDLVEKALDKQELQRKLVAAELKVTELQSALDSAKEEAGRWANRHDEQLALHLEAKDALAQGKEVRLAQKKQIDALQNALSVSREDAGKWSSLHYDQLARNTATRVQLAQAEHEVTRLQAMLEHMPELRQLVDKQAQKIDELCRRPERVLFHHPDPCISKPPEPVDKEVRCAGRIIQSLYPGAVLQTTAGFCHAVKEVWSIGMQTYALTEAFIDKKQTRTVWQQEGQDLVPCKDPVALPEEYTDIRYKSTWALGDKVRLDEHLFGEVTCLEREGEELVAVQITVYHKDSKRFYWLVRRRLGGQLALTDRYAEKKAT